MQSYVIHYTYKNKPYTVTTKPCTLAQAKAAFEQEVNSLNTFKLVKIVGA